MLSACTVPRYKIVWFNEAETTLDPLLFGLNVRLLSHARSLGYAQMLDSSHQFVLLLAPNVSEAAAMYARFRL